MSARIVKNMAKAKTKNTGKLRRSKRKVKRPNMQSPQNCVLNSTSKAKSRKKQKMREQWVERKRRQRMKDQKSEQQPGYEGRNGKKKSDIFSLLKLYVLALL